MTRYELELKKTQMEFPGFKVLYKSKSPFMKLINAFVRFFCKDFMTNFVTTIGLNMWVPDSWGLGEDEEMAGTIRHERVHLRQQRVHGMVAYAFLYLLWPLPFFRAEWRTRFEMAAYEETMRAMVEYRGVVSIADAGFRDWLLDVFTGSSYGWMCTDRARMRAWYDEVAAHLAKEAK